MACKDIISAIQHLPENLITNRIIWEGLKTGNIKLLNFLPDKYMKSHLIEMLLRYDKSERETFDLDLLLEGLRTKAVCERAVKGNAGNYKYVPDELKSTGMLRTVMPAVKDNFHFIPTVPPATWDAQAVYDAIKSFNSGNGYNYHNPYLNDEAEDVRRCYSKGKSIKFIQVLLTCVPEEIKNKAFYHGLFKDSIISVPDIDFITPTRFKNKRYYTLMAARAFQYVPPSKVDYNSLYTAIESRSLRRSAIFDDDSDYRKRIFEMMDDKMADLIAIMYPERFNRLPLKFLTSQRLYISIQKNPNCNDFCNLIPKKTDEKDQKQAELYDRMMSLLNKVICRMLIKINEPLPVFPAGVWDERFVDFCMKHGTEFEWFDQLPKELQTQEIVNAALEFDPENLEYVHRSFINSYMAMKLYRCGKSVKKHVPKEFLEQFKEDTGLNEKFFGGEITYLEMRDNKDYRMEDVYFQSGNSFIGFHRPGGSHGSYKLVMTKPAANGQAPTLLFDKFIKTFHINWLEKMIADNESGFMKPTVIKSYRHLQFLNYYDVEKDVLKNGVQIYRNTFRGETIGFVALRDDELIFEAERDDLFQYFEEEETKLPESIVAETSMV